MSAETGNAKEVPFPKPGSTFRKYSALTILYELMSTLINGIALVVLQFPLSSLARRYRVFTPFERELKSIDTGKLAIFAEGVNPVIAFAFPKPGSVLKKYSMRLMFCADALATIAHKTHSKQYIFRIAIQLFDFTLIVTGNVFPLLLEGAVNK
jgi:hypothetical protein